MLVLSRKLNEGIQIGTDIRIVVVEVRRGGLVRLGIEAPRDVEVFRDEIVKRREKDRGGEKKSRSSRTARNDQHVA